MTSITHPDAIIRIDELNNGRRRIAVKPKNPKTYVHFPSCVTNYPDQLLKAILNAKGAAYLCDEILREQDPNYIRRHLELAITSYIDKKTMTGKRLLDFGCGAGASSVILAQLLKKTEIVGVELEDKNLAVAKARRDFYKLTNISLHHSPNGNELPKDLGMFDYIVLSAVYEHLLPEERKNLLPKIWNLLKTDGVLFMDETPHRWFPVETHTTHLPFINYLPDRLALWYARRFSKRINRKASWPDLLRAGIRGGTPRMVLRDLKSQKSNAEILMPAANGLRSPVSLWYEGYVKHATGRFAVLKRFAVPILKLLSVVFGTPVIPYLTIAIQKKRIP